MNFAEALKRSRKLRHKTQKEMAAFLGITERGYQSYEQEEREPPIAKLIALARYFNVSIDYLVGESDDPARR